MANAVEDTPKKANNYENEGENENANIPIINANANPLREFIIEYQLQQIEQPLLSSGLSITMLLSLTEAEIDEISKELTESAMARVKFKYSVKQIQLKKQKVKSNNNENNKNENQITHKFMNKYEEKIYVFTMVTAINDRGKARQILEENNWDLHASVAKQFGVTPGNNAMDDNEHKTPMGPPPPYNNNKKTEITLILSDNRQFKYSMKYTDTFWTVYANLLQSASDMTSKLFDLQLPNGHTLKENEFDQTLSEHKLIPKGIININVRNNNNCKPRNGNTIINVIIIHPINQKLFFNMKGKDTIWGLYSLLLQSVPELSTKVFTLQLSNGHILKEYEFDNTLQHLRLVPKGDIVVKFGNQYNKNKHKNYNNKQHYNKYNKPKPSYKQNISKYAPHPSHYNSNNNQYAPQSSNNQMKQMLDKERQEREKYQKEMEDRRRKQEREQKERERKRKEMERKRKQDFIRAVRNGLPRIGTRQNQCAKCGLGFNGNSEGNKQRWEHQKMCSKTWNCGICGRNFDRFSQHQSHVRSCSNVKMMY